MRKPTNVYPSLFQSLAPLQREAAGGLITISTLVALCCVCVGAIYHADALTLYNVWDYASGMWVATTPWLLVVALLCAIFDQ